MRERFFRTGPRGLDLCLCEWGEPTGRPLVVLHGFLEQGAAWDAVAQQLNRWVIAPDHRGHGRSAHVGAGGFYHFWDYLPDVDALVRSLGEPVDLVGHSMGGTMASLYAATRPEAVRRLVLIEGLGPPDLQHRAAHSQQQFVQQVQSPPVHRPFASVPAAAARMRQHVPALRENTALRLAERMSRPLTDDERREYPDLGPAARIWRWDPLHRSRSPVPFRADAFGDALARITCPVLLIDGAHSDFRPDDLAERAARLSRRTEVTLPGGHMLHHDVPGPLATTLTDFFAAAEPT